MYKFIHAYTYLYICTDSYTYVYKIRIMFVVPSEKDQGSRENFSQPQAPNDHLSFVTPKSTPSARTKNDSVEDYLMT